MSQLDIGDMDPTLRILVCVLLAGLAGFLLIGNWGSVGLILIATGTIAICSLYSLLGVRTTSR